MTISWLKSIIQRSIRQTQPRVTITLDVYEPGGETKCLILKLA